MQGINHATSKNKYLHIFNLKNFTAKIIVYFVTQYPHLRVFHLMSEKPSNGGIAKIVILLFMCVLYFFIF